MNLSVLVRRLEDMGFKRASSDARAAAYTVTDRFEHDDEKGSSVFVGDGDEVSFRGQRTKLHGTGAFLIANGRSRGMTARLLELGIKPTRSIRDPGGRAQDRCWRGDEALSQLLKKMAEDFH